MEEENWMLLERPQTPMELSVTTMHNLSAAITVQSKLLEILSGDTVMHPAMDGTLLTADVLLGLFAASHTEDEIGEA